MSATQFHKAVANPERYSLISAQMWHFDQQRAENDETLTLEEINPLLRVCNNIGVLEKDLKKRVDEAFRGGEEDIRINGSYDVRVPQRVFNLNFNDLIVELKQKFS